jgi:hypothetical protein
MKISAYPENNLAELVFSNWGWSPLIGSFEMSVDLNKQMISKTHTKVSQMLLIRAIYSISRL